MFLEVNFTQNDVRYPTGHTLIVRSFRKRTRCSVSSLTQNPQFTINQNANIQTTPLVLKSLRTCQRTAHFEPILVVIRNDQNWVRKWADLGE